MGNDRLLDPSFSINGILILQAHFKKPFDNFQTGSKAAFIHTNG